MDSRDWNYGEIEQLERLKHDLKLGVISQEEYYALIQPYWDDMSL